MSQVFDKSKPHEIVKDFNSGRTVLVQNGKRFAPGGFLLIEAKPVKYPCPKCDFGAGKGSELLAHAISTHQATASLLECVQVYVKNIDRGLERNEGIDWTQSTVNPTREQQIIDQQEADEAKNPPAPELAAPAAPALAPAPVDPETLRCKHCEFVGKNPFGLMGHMKKHAKPNETNDDRQAAKKKERADLKKING